MRLKKCLALALALLLLALLPAGCGKDGESPKASQAEPSQASESEPDPEYPVNVGGAVISSRPGKIVSLAPSLTEKICDLGYESRLMGISDYHGDYPASITTLPSYGIASLPDTEGILKLRPNAVFSVSELPADAMDALSDAGIVLVILPSYAESMAQLEEIYMGIASALDGRTTGRMIGERFMRDFNARIENIAAGYAGEAPKNAVYLRALDYTMATGDTLEGELMERIGFVNVASGQSGWSFDPDEANAEAGRELFRSVEIMFFDPNYVSMKQGLEKSAFWKGLNCVLKDLYITIDSDIFERQSLRMLEQLERMAEGLAGDWEPDIP